MQYEIVDQTLKNIVTIYILFAGACIVTLPIMKLIVKAAAKGLSKWR